MTRRRLRRRWVQHAALRAAASPIGELLGWDNAETTAFAWTVVGSPWRHCGQSEMIGLLKLSGLLPVRPVDKEVRDNAGRV